ncbi:hypothetical protein D9M68_636660 [compost metagenome]
MNTELEVLSTIHYHKPQQINEPHADNLVRHLYHEQCIDGINGSADDAFSLLEPVLTDKGLWRLRAVFPHPAARNDA